MGDYLIGLIIFIIISLLSLIGFNYDNGELTQLAIGAENIDDSVSGSSVNAITDITGGRTPINKLQAGVGKQYSEFAIKNKKKPPSFKEFCFPTKYKLQPVQKFLAKYMAPGSPNNDILAFHRIGAGKTCSAISIAESHIRNDMKPLVLMPASLLPGFRNELRSECPQFDYITSSERRLLATLPQHNAQRKDILTRSNELIDSRYQLYSYNKFLLSVDELSPTSVMIIDEVQNVNNPNGVFYRAIVKFIEANPRMKIVLLSATPLFDAPSEIISLLKLMRVDCDPEIINNIELPQSVITLKKLLEGKISYYEGAPARVFPTINLKYDICKMSKFQTKWYTAEVENEINKRGVLAEHATSDNFYIKSRAKSNIVFPRGLAGTDGLPKLTKTKLLHLEKFSCKFAKLIKRLHKGQLSFVYTNFTSYGGVKTIRHCLRAFGFIEFNKHGPGRKRFAVWTGEQTAVERDRIRSTYNSSQNDDASQLQIIVGSPSMKEGVSLFRTRQVHVLEPYWNHSRHAQIFGRASRFCSHKSLPARDRTVDIYLYIAVTNWSKCTTANIAKKSPMITPSESVDAYILNIADSKNEHLNVLNNILIDIAVDRKLNQKN
jgi:hypothetical protein